MDERFAQVSDDITLCYETFGDPADPTILLIMGLGTQMVAWHEDLCRDLAGRGYHVVRYDNRDIGRSTHLAHLPPPTVAQLLRRSRNAGYLLADMARDAIGLLDHLGVGAAHIVGASMGGMIAQTIAATYPERTLSLTSIMSNTGARWSGQPALRLYPIFLRRPGRDREEYIRHTLRLFTLIGSPGFERDDDDTREMAGLSYDRGHDPAGSARQLGAIVASGDRTEELRKITAPTLVIHGEADKLVAPSGGRATARAIRGARLMTIPGMGHDLPRGTWPRVVDAIDELARSADASSDEAEAA
jgi:pimeloyl-ACP methyl ester carboxylesterase